LAESVSKHLELCRDCRQRIAEVSADSFLGRLRLNFIGFGDAKSMTDQRNPHSAVPAATQCGRGTEPRANLSERLQALRSPAERSDTVLESDEDVRQAWLSAHNVPPHIPGAFPLPADQLPPMPVTAQPFAARSAIHFRPTARAPIALLTVFDDGRAHGEVIRLRQPKFTIGRTQGDLRIPLDPRISARHVEVTCENVGGLHRWVITDLKSTHGLFVRVSRTVLADKAEILVGKGRYRFDASEPRVAPAGDSSPRDPDRSVTRGWDDCRSPLRSPALNELLGSEIGNRTLLVKNEYWIGSDPSCPICRPDDPFCEPWHVRLYRKPTGAWLAEHNKTTNGVWLRMSQIVVDAIIQFQLGEQRFQLRLG
jgi:pSer/pThr/pTyr-binding forkhead associated (FHA) protein